MKLNQSRAVELLLIIDHLAEQTIQQEETKPGFSLVLLGIVQSDSYPNTTRLASALFFKNFVKRNWTVCDIVAKYWWSQAYDL